MAFGLLLTTVVVWTKATWLGLGKEHRVKITTLSLISDITHVT